MTVEKHFQSSDENDFQLGILHSAKISSKCEIKVKKFSDMEEIEICSP